MAAVTSGSIPSVSLSPVTGCAKGVPCAQDGCFSLQMCSGNAKVRDCWSSNGRLARGDPESYFAMIRDCLKRRKPPLFRWHVGGDILSQSYLQEMETIAREFPATRFLAFTKQFGLDYSNQPQNLTIIFSMWPGMPKPKRQKGIRFAWLQDGTERRVPRNAMRCVGACENCGLCWELPNLNRDVVFVKRRVVSACGPLDLSFSSGPRPGAWPSGRSSPYVKGGPEADRRCATGEVGADKAGKA